MAHKTLALLALCCMIIFVTPLVLANCADFVNQPQRPCVEFTDSKNIDMSAGSFKNVSIHLKGVHLYALTYKIGEDTIRAGLPSYTFSEPEGTFKIPVYALESFAGKTVTLVISSLDDSSDSDSIQIDVPAPTSSDAAQFLKLNVVTEFISPNDQQRFIVKITGGNIEDNSAIISVNGVSDTITVNQTKEINGLRVTADNIFITNIPTLSVGAAVRLFSSNRQPPSLSNARIEYITLNEPKSFFFNEEVFNVEIIGGNIENNSAIVSVNGEIQSLSQGETKIINGLVVFAKDIFVTDIPTLSVGMSAVISTNSEASLFVFAKHIDEAGQIKYLGSNISKLNGQTANIYSSRYSTNTQYSGIIATTVIVFKTKLAAENFLQQTLIARSAQNDMGTNYTVENGSIGSYYVIGHQNITNFETLIWRSGYAVFETKWIGWVNDLDDSAKTNLRATAQAYLNFFSSDNPSANTPTTVITPTVNTDITYGKPSDCYKEDGTQICINITSPKRGDVYRFNQSINITWTQSSNIDMVTIGFKRCESCLDWIANNIPVDGNQMYQGYSFTPDKYFHVTNMSQIYIIAYKVGFGSVSVTTGFFDIIENTSTPSTPSLAPTTNPNVGQTPTTSANETIPVKIVVENITKSNQTIKTIDNGIAQIVFGKNVTANNGTPFSTFLTFEQLNDKFNYSEVAIVIYNNEVRVITSSDASDDVKENARKITQVLAANQQLIVVQDTPTVAKLVYPMLFFRDEQSLQSDVACPGCFFNDQCYTKGSTFNGQKGIMGQMREFPMYCSSTSTIEAQKEDEQACVQDYECLTNYCGANVCKAEPDALGKVVDFFRGFFSGL